MVLASIPIENKRERSRFFQETFLVAKTSMDVDLGMPFLTLSNSDVQFADRELTWRSYTPAEALPTTKREQIID